MQTVFYIIIICITWYAIGVEKTRNSALKSMLVKVERLENAEGFVAIRQKLRKSETEQRKTLSILTKTSKLLTFTGIILIVGNIFCLSVIDLKSGFNINFELVLFIISNLTLAINSYVSGCKIEKKQLEFINMIVDKKHEANMIRFDSLGNKLFIIFIILIIIYFFVV